jgi:ribosomal protein S18 acetylase RimI-like enzyme
LRGPISVRPFREGDYDYVAANIDAWTQSTTVRYFVLRRFVHHFRDTCFVAEVDAQIAGFLIGWLSQSAPKEAFINNVIVAPEFRRMDVATALNEHFFRKVKALGRIMVSATIRADNRVSLAFHRELGFKFRTVGASPRENVPVLLGWDGPGEDKVLAEIDLTDWDG